MRSRMRGRRSSLLRKRAAVSVLCFGAVFSMLSGCSGRQGEKTVLTVFIDTDLECLETLVESTFSDIDLQCERLSDIGEQERRLEQGTGSDLVIVKQPSYEMEKKYLLDIGDTEASALYDGTVMKQLQADGTIYLLPLPGAYGGYIVNETLFREAGFDLPSTNQELLEALETMKEQQIGVGEDGTNFSVCSDYDVELGIYYIGYMVPDFLGTVEGVAWLSDFWDKQEYFTGTWEKMFDLTEQMAEAGVLDVEVLSEQHNAALRQKRMANGTLAAAVGNTSLYQNCVEENRSNVISGKAQEYSYRMLPLLSDEGAEPWLLLTPNAYIGINAAADETKQEAAKRVLALISTVDGQEALMEDLQMGFSYLQEKESDTGFVPGGLEAYIQSGYIYNVQFPDQIVECLGSQIRKVLAGEITKEACLKAIDQCYYESPAGAPSNSKQRRTP